MGRLCPDLLIDYPKLRERKLDAQNILAGMLRSRGFKRKGRLFERVANGVIHMAMLSKARFNGQSFLDVGVIHPRVEGHQPAFPLSWEINSRADEFLENLPGGGRGFLDALNDDKNLEPNQRAKDIEDGLDTLEEQFYSKFMSEEQLETFARHPTMPHVLCQTKLKEYANSHR